MTSKIPDLREAPRRQSGIHELSPPAQRAVDAAAKLAETLSSDERLEDVIVSRPHPLLVMVRRKEQAVLILTAATWDKTPEVLAPYAEQLTGFAARGVVLGRPSDTDLKKLMNAGIGAMLPAEPSIDELYVAVQQAFDFVDVKGRSESRGKWVNRYRYELGELIEIARAITTEKEIDKLLGLILEKARFVTGADAGSIYVVEGDDVEISRRQLHFKLSQNDSMSFDSSEFEMPINPRSMAGFVALERKTLNIDDVYDLPPGSSFGFDRSFDEKTGYRTRSMLCSPLVSSKGEVMGVVQLINKKREPKQKLFTPADFDRQVIPFDNRSEQLLSTLAAQAGISLENAILYEEIRGIFEGFVRASVDAIEARDPTTSGHSRRVAELTTGLAHAVERIDTGLYKEVTWTPEDLREIEYAALLHDFGKIGVRENVLVKAKKLYPHELEAVRARFDFVIRTIEADVLARKVTALERGASRAELEDLDRELTERKQELHEAWNTVQQANEPTVLAAGDFRKIEELGRQTYARLTGSMGTLLSEEEVRSLSVMRGSLTPEEYDEIRSHVSHTYRFLSQIPWGKSFSRIAPIAGAHHERLNGTGYPNRLHAEEIPLQSKIMTVSDIFDALTASDRPYKRAVPVEKALDILGFEVKDGHVDGELVRIFTDARPWEPVMGALY